MAFLFFLLSLLEQIKIQILRDVLQHLDAAHAVALLVQRRAEHADAHPVHQRRRDAAAHAALGREAHRHGKLARAVIHPAGQHQRADGLGALRRDQLLARARAGAVVCQHRAHLRDVHRRHIHRAHPEIKVQTLLHVALQNAAGLQVICQRPVAVAGRLLREVDRLV